jgi:Zn-dependent protease
VPITPLDGSKVLAAFLSSRAREKFLSLERFGLVLVILFVMLAGSTIIPVVRFLFDLIVGK